MTQKRQIQRAITGICLALGLVSGAVTAADRKRSPPEPPASERARLEDILQKFDAAQGQIRTMTANFTETKALALLKAPVVSKGKFFYTHPSDVLWEYLDPTPRVFLINREQLLAYYPAEKRAEQLDISHYQNKLLRVLGIGQVSRDLKKYYDISLAPDEGEATKFHLLLSPRRHMIKTRIEAIHLWVDTKSYLPVRMQYREPDGDSTTITFDDVLQNQRIDEATYKIDLPPGVTVEHSFTGLSGSKGAS